MAQQPRTAGHAQYRALFAWAPVGIAMATLDGRLVEVNPAFCSFIGYREDELVGRPFADLTHPDDRGKSDDLYRQVRDGDVASVTFEKRYVRKDGQTVRATVTSSIIRRDDGAPTHTVATVMDITARYNAQERVERSASLQRVAGTLARVGGWSVDVATNEVSWSGEIYRLLEWSQEHPPPLEAALRLYTPPHREQILNALQTCAATGAPFDLEVDVTTFGGKPLVVRVLAEPQRGPDGSVTHVIGAFQDITELRAATRRTRELAARLTTTFESITDAFFTLDREWRFTYINHRAEVLLERNRESLLDRNVWAEFPEAVGTPIYEAYHRAMRAGTTEVLEEIFYAPLDTWLTIRAYPSPQGLAVYFHNVSEQRKARMVLLDREARLVEQAALLDAARDAILVRDLEHRITFWNNGAERVYGWTAAEALGRSKRDLLPQEPAEFDRANEMLLRDGEWQGRLVQRTKAGTPLVAECRWTLVRDAGGEPHAVLEIQTDITERDELESQLLRAQRLESIGTLAGGMAHDLNNILSPIMISTDLLAADETDPKRLALLTGIATSARRGGDMVGQILSFARGVEGRVGPMDVATLLDDVQRIVEDTFLKSITVVRADDASLWPVRGDATQLHQVLINLCVNARDAMPDGGTLWLGSDSVIIDEQHAALNPGAKAGEYVRVRVADTGHGMDADVLDRIFEPFFTTKERGRGTGLGLSTSARIIADHGGFISVDSEPGKGTTFLVHLPAAADSAPVESHADIPAPPRGNGEVVLVVDDEQQIRFLLRTTLEQFGYGVLDAADGVEALAMLGDHADDVAVVITDMVMPGLDGPATIRQLRTIRPDVPIVAASGFHSDLQTAEAAELGVQQILAKPFTVPTLLRVLRQVLHDT